jgi:hypothetical protein
VARVAALLSQFIDRRLYLGRKRRNLAGGVLLHHDRDRSDPPGGVAVAEPGDQRAGEPVRRR